MRRKLHLIGGPGTDLDLFQELAGVGIVEGDEAVIAGTWRCECDSENTAAHLNVGDLKVVWRRNAEHGNRVGWITKI